MEVHFADAQESVEVSIPVVPSNDDRCHEHFRVVLCEPQPDNIKLSMRNYCVVQIKRTEADYLWEVRSHMLNGFI